MPFSVDLSAEIAVGYIASVDTVDKIFGSGVVSCGIVNGELVFRLLGEKILTGCDGYRQAEQ